MLLLLNSHDLLRPMHTQITRIEWRGKEACLESKGVLFVYCFSVVLQISVAVLGFEPEVRVA